MSKTNRGNPMALSCNRRTFLKGAAATGIAGTLALPGSADARSWDAFLQKRFREMSDGEKNGLIERLEREASEKWGKPIRIGTEPARPGVKFGYGLDLSRCVGCRRCVYACVDENNQSRDPQVHWITVLRFKKGDKWIDLEGSDKYYKANEVPEKDYFYVPVQCQQCENSPCAKACPTGATWKEPDGIVTIDYDWCIGCRYCMAACAYGARRFNWGEPGVRPEDINPETHYLGNRPRTKGVVEKCTMCIQRTRAGKYPACVEICPAGARKFGNLLDPESEIRRLITSKRVFRLKEDLNSDPKFFYFFAA